MYVNLPEIGSRIEIGNSFSDIESVKAIAEIISPVNGRVEKVNETLNDNPELINEDAEACWIIKVKDVDEVSDKLMTEEEYNNSICI